MFTSVYLTAAISIFIFMCCMFMVGTLAKNNGLVDVGWGLGFCVVAIVTFITFGKNNIHQLIITALTLLWGLRLAIFLGQRNIGKPEDFRYANWRREWGKWVIPRSFLQVYMLQGLVMFFVALPIMVTNASAVLPEKVSITAIVGILIFTLGFYFEAVGDAQKMRFKKDPANKGKFITSGLWQYTRHPNYFGEALLWWGIFLVAIPAGQWYISIISPIAINFFLIRVSGIPMLEVKYDGNEAYQAYKKRTSAFVPMPPKQF